MTEVIRQKTYGMVLLGCLAGVSFAPQLQGQPKQPRQWIHSFFWGKYFIRDARYKLRENGDLFNVSGAAYTETLVPPGGDTAESKAAREELRGVLEKLHPQQGKGSRGAKNGGVSRNSETKTGGGK